MDGTVDWVKVNIFKVKSTHTSERWDTKRNQTVRLSINQTFLSTCHLELTNLVNIFRILSSEQQTKTHEQTDDCAKMLMRRN